MNAFLKAELRYCQLYVLKTMLLSRNVIQTSTAVLWDQELAGL